MKYIFVLVEFKRTEFFASYGDCLLNTKLSVPSVGFSEAGLDHTKFGFYQFQSFVFIIDYRYRFYLKLHFHKFQSIASYWWKFCSDRTRKKNTFKAIEKYRYGLWKTVSKHLNSDVSQILPRKRCKSELIISFETQKIIFSLNAAS